MIVTFGAGGGVPIRTLAFGVLTSTFTAATERLAVAKTSAKPQAILLMITLLFSMVSQMFIDGRYCQSTESAPAWISSRTVVRSSAEITISS